MFAIISDIHSNLEALTAVLADIEARGIKTIYCLGDVIGYGPDPKPCLDMIIERTKWCVLGNHDYAIFYEPTNFNYGAEQASFWTRDILEAEEEKEPRDKRWVFLGNLPMRRTLQTALGTEEATIDFVHASPRKPINEYIFPDEMDSQTENIESRKIINKDFKVDSRIIDDFKSFLQAKEIEYDKEEFESALGEIKRWLKREFYSFFWGIEEGRRVFTQSDPFVLKAIEILPEAEALVNKK